MSDPTPAIVAHAEWKTSGPKGRDIDPSNNAKYSGKLFIPVQLGV